MTKLKHQKIVEQFYGDEPKKFLERVNIMIGEAKRAGGLEDTFRFETEMQYEYGNEWAALVLEYQRPETQPERLERENTEERARNFKLNQIREQAEKYGYRLTRKPE